MGYGSRLVTVFATGKEEISPNIELKKELRKRKTLLNSTVDHLEGHLKGG